MREPVSRPAAAHTVRAFVCLGLVTLAACSEKPEEAEFVTQIPWSFSERWLAADLHTHTTFSDGEKPVEALIGLARKNGCDVIAVTDHSDAAEQAASPEYFQAIAAVRLKFPGKIVFAGLEWNIPPYAGREHATLLVDPAIEASLGEFKAKFETGQADPVAALQWLAERRGAPQEALLVYNHPSRKDADVAENLADYNAWHAVNDLFVGFEGGPGHQRADPRGEYKDAIASVDGWDPVVAVVGGVWDRLLEQGVDAWGALANSDYHNDKLDYAPCQFSRTHLLVAERTPEAALAALRAGSFWADQGRILDGLEFTASSASLVVPAVPGESFTLGGDGEVRVRVVLGRGPGAGTAPLRVELIGNAREGKPAVLEVKELAPDSSEAEWTFSGLTAGADGRSVYFRLRVSSDRSPERRLVAYTNAVRVYLDKAE